MRWGYSALRFCKTFDANGEASQLPVVPGVLVGAGLVVSAELWGMWENGYALVSPLSVECTKDRTASLRKVWSKAGPWRILPSLQEEHPALYCTPFLGCFRWKCAECSAPVEVHAQYRPGGDPVALD